MKEFNFEKELLSVQDELFRFAYKLTADREKAEDLQSAWPFIRQLISPLVISILIALVLIPMQYALEGMNIFVTIIAKGIVRFIIFGIYIQMTHEYDMISKVRSLRKKSL